MCVIVFKPKNSIFTRESFDKCWARNGHGLGFVAVDEQLYTKKGLMTPESAWDELSKFTGVGYDLVVHFRIQSRGGISPSLTHPFEFSNDSDQRFLFHNGTVRPLNVTGQTSDTEALSKLLKTLSCDDTSKLLTILAAEKYGKFITVNFNPVSGPCIDMYDSPTSVATDDKNSSYIDGVWYSNTVHLSYKTSAGSVLVGDDFCDYPYNTKAPVGKNDRIKMLLTDKENGDTILTDIRLSEDFLPYHHHQIFTSEAKIIDFALLK